MDWSLDSARKYLESALSDEPIVEAPPAQNPSQIQVTLREDAESYFSKNEEESSLTDQAYALAQSAWNSASTWGEKKWEEAVAAYDSAAKKVDETTDKMYTYAQEVYQDYKEEVITAIKEGAKQIFGEDSEDETPPPSPQEVEQSPQDPKKELTVEVEQKNLELSKADETDQKARTVVSVDESKTESTQVDQSEISSSSFRTTVTRTTSYSTSTTHSTSTASNTKATISDSTIPATAEETLQAQAEGAVASNNSKTKLTAGSDTKDTEQTNSSHTETESTSSSTAQVTATNTNNQTGSQNEQDNSSSQDSEFSTDNNNSSEEIQYQEIADGIESDPLGISSTLLIALSGTAPDSTTSDPVSRPAVSAERRGDLASSRSTGSDIGTKFSPDALQDSEPGTYRPRGIKNGITDPELPKVNTLSPEIQVSQLQAPLPSTVEEAQNPDSSILRTAEQAAIAANVANKPDSKNSGLSRDHRSTLEFEDAESARLNTASRSDNGANSQGDSNHPGHSSTELASILDGSNDPSTGDKNEDNPVTDWSEEIYKSSSGISVYA